MFGASFDGTIEAARDWYVDLDSVRRGRHNCSEASVEAVVWVVYVQVYGRVEARAVKGKIPIPC